MSAIPSFISGDLYSRMTLDGKRSSLTEEICTMLLLTKFASRFKAKENGSAVETCSLDQRRLPDTSGGRKASAILDR